MLNTYVVKVETDTGVHELEVASKFGTKGAEQRAKKIVLQSFGSTQHLRIISTTDLGPWSPACVGSCPIPIPAKEDA